MTVKRLIGVSIRILAFAATLALVVVVIPVAAKGHLVSKWDDRVVHRVAHSLAYWKHSRARHPSAYRHWHTTRAAALAAHRRLYPSHVPSQPPLSAPPPKAALPPFPASPSTPGPIDYQGGIRSDGPWGQLPNREWRIGTIAGQQDPVPGSDGRVFYLHDPAGNRVGYWIDDTVVIPETWASEAQWVRWARANAPPGQQWWVVAASPMGNPDWEFESSGADYTAYEWFPHCRGLNDAFNMAWTFTWHRAYVMQWNFSWSRDYPGTYDDPNCTAPSAADHQAAFDLIANANLTRPVEVLLYY